jgi:RNA polymerase sigma factor (sigma-70 family)
MPARVRLPISQTNLCNAWLPSASYLVERGLPVGQLDDYADLYGQYLPRILNYIRLRVDDEAVAQDLTAAAFERAVSKQHTLRRREAFGAWLFKIARNVVAGYYRGRQPTVPLEQAAGQRTEALSLPEAVMRQQELARMLEALSMLSERDQEIIRLKFAAGLGNQEIGKVMRMRAGHVAVVQHRALRKLRTIMDRDAGAAEAPPAPADGPGRSQRQAD